MALPLGTYDSPYGLFFRRKIRPVIPRTLSHYHLLLGQRRGDSAPKIGPPPDVTATMLARAPDSRAEIRAGSLQKIRSGHAYSVSARPIPPGLGRR